MQLKMLNKLENLKSQKHDSIGSRKMASKNNLIKVKYEDDMIRFNVVTDYGTPRISLHDLKSKILNLFKLNGDADELKVRYTDEDGDVIVIANDEGLQDAFNQNLCSLRLEVSLSRNSGSYLKYREISFHNLGPFGGGGGIDWNDGKFEGINGITVTTNSISLLSIQVSYATGKDEATYTAARHGGEGAAICMKFNYPTEKLQKISGYCGLVENTWTVIKGLSFETNVAKYGPFGVSDWVPFEFDLRSRDVVGIYGRACNRFLGSIGLHTLP